MEAIGQNIVITVDVDSPHRAQKVTRAIHEALREVNENLRLTWDDPGEIRE